MQQFTVWGRIISNSRQKALIENLCIYCSHSSVLKMNCCQNLWNPILNYLYVLHSSQKNEVAQILKILLCLQLYTRPNFGSALRCCRFETEAERLPNCHSSPFLEHSRWLVACQPILCWMQRAWTKSVYFALLSTGLAPRGHGPGLKIVQAPKVINPICIVVIIVELHTQRVRGVCSSLLKETN